MRANNGNASTEQRQSMRQQFQFFNIFGSDLKIDKDGEQARDDKDFRNLTLELTKTPKIKIF